MIIRIFVFQVMFPVSMTAYMLIGEHTATVLNGTILVILLKICVYVLLVFDSVAAHRIF